MIRWLNSYYNHTLNQRNNVEINNYQYLGMGLYDLNKIIWNFKGNFVDLHKKNYKSYGKNCISYSINYWNICFKNLPKKIY